MTDLFALANRTENGKGCDNALDVRIEIALFKPGCGYIAIRSNFAGTKVIYTRDDGSEVTHWAEEWTGDRAKAARLLREKAEEGVGV